MANQYGRIPKLPLTEVGCANIALEGAPEPHYEIEFGAIGKGLLYLEQVALSVERKVMIKSTGESDPRGLNPHKVMNDKGFEVPFLFPNVTVKDPVYVYRVIAIGAPSQWAALVSLTVGDLVLMLRDATLEERFFNNDTNLKFDGQKDKFAYTIAKDQDVECRIKKYSKIKEA